MKAKPFKVTKTEVELLNNDHVILFRDLEKQPADRTYTKSGLMVMDEESDVFVYDYRDHITGETGFTSFTCPYGGKGSCFWVKEPFYSYIDNQTGSRRIKYYNENRLVEERLYKQPARKMKMTDSRKVLILEDADVSIDMSGVGNWVLDFEVRTRR